MVIISFPLMQHLHTECLEEADFTFPLGQKHLSTLWTPAAVHSPAFEFPIASDGYNSVSQFQVYSCLGGM